MDPYNDYGKEDDISTIPVHGGVEDNVLFSATMRTPSTILQNQDDTLYISTTDTGLTTGINDRLHIGSVEYIANQPIESTSIASSDSFSATTDLDDEELPETRATQDKVIAKKESEEVYHFKVIVLLFLLLSAVAVAPCVNIYVRKKEQSQFDEKFRTDALKVFDTVRNSIDQTLIRMDSLAVDLVSYARATNATWPFVTLPNFGLRMSKALPQTDAILIQTLVLVEPNQRKKWESYVGQNTNWLNESMAIQEAWDGYYGPIAYNWETKDVIWSDDGDVEANVRLVSHEICVVFHRS
jgi:hypothetical protein